LVLIAVLALPSCQQGPSIPVASITIGMESTAVNSLIYIAENQGYFAANRLNVTIKDSYPSGAAAAEAMLNGEVEFATAAELAVVRHAFAGRDVRVLASIDTFMHMKLIARTDGGIGNAADLAGRTVGAPTRSAADFMLSRFFALNRVDSGKVTVVDVQAPQAVDALTNAEVDAVVAWQPNVMALQDQLGDRILVWDVQSGQPLYCALVTTEQWLSNNSAAAERFISALLQATLYVARYPDRAKARIQQKLQYDDRYIQTIWPSHTLSARLDQSLILAMEDQARWMIKNGLTSETEVPDFLGYIREDILEKMSPGAVNIIR
jgi:NitT/TauT family transport system substrate-binding protein